MFVVREAGLEESRCRYEAADDVEVLEIVKKYGAVYVKDMIDLAFNGNRWLCYKKIEKLQEQRLIKKKEFSANRKVKYVTLTGRGAERVGANPKKPTPSNVNRSLTGSALAAGLVRAGIDKDSILTWREYLELIKNHSGETSSLENTLLQLAVKNKKGYYLLYTSVGKRYQAKLLNSAEKMLNDVSVLGDVLGNVFVVSDRRQWYKDRKWFVFVAGTADIDVPVYLWEKDAAPFLFAELLADNPKETLFSVLRKVLGSGELKKLPNGVYPLFYAYVRNKSILVGDLRFDDIVTASRAARITHDTLKLCGMEGVVLVVRDRAHVNSWHRVFVDSAVGRLWLISAEDGRVYVPSMNGFCEIR